MKNLLLIILVFLINACSKDDSQSTILDPAKVNTVYVGGSQMIGGKEKATIWKNGIAQLLATDANNSSRVNSVFVSESDVYAVGFEVFPTVIRAVLWKNGTNIVLEYNSSEAYSIQVFKDKIYIVGQFDNKATLWTNGNGNFANTNLTSTNPSIAKSVFLANDGTYLTSIAIVGFVGTNAWTYINNNNILFTNTSVAESVFVRGSEVFVAVNIKVLGFETASLKKNGVALNTEIPNSVMYSVHGDEQNIYAVGTINPNTTNSRATIWENYIPKQLSQIYSKANSVFVADKNVYVAGWQYNNSTSKYNACLWINGTVQTLSNEDCQVKSVFVTLQ